MLVGLIVLGFSAGTYRISAILDQAPALVTGPGGAVTVAVVLILVGAITKSALVPFHFWLPGAMAAPTPVSAYLHAAAMVKAGIYLVARLAPGSRTPPLAADRARPGPGHHAGRRLPGAAADRHQAHPRLRHGQPAGLPHHGGGPRQPRRGLAGLALLLAHGLFKATLFLVVGIVDHQAGTRDIRELSGVSGPPAPSRSWAAIGAASMAGVPPLAGYVAKESVFEAFIEYTRRPPPACGGRSSDGVVLGSILTFAYSARFMWGAFAVKPGVDPTAFKPVKPAFLAAPAILSLLTVVYGLWPAPVDGWIQPYAELFVRRPDPSSAGHLALWHGSRRPWG